MPWNYCTKIIFISKHSLRLSKIFSSSIMRTFFQLLCSISPLLCCFFFFFALRSLLCSSLSALFRERLSSSERFFILQLFSIYFHWKNSNGTFTIQKFLHWPLQCFVLLETMGNECFSLFFGHSICSAIRRKNKLFVGSSYYAKWELVQWLIMTALAE